MLHSKPNNYITMVDYSKLAQAAQKVADSKPAAQKPAKQNRVADSKKLTDEQKKAIKDAIEKRKQAQQQKSTKIEDSKEYFKALKVKDSYKDLFKKVKDALEDTETTEDAVCAALDTITEDTPAEDVLATVVEVLGETIDELQAEDDEYTDEELDEIEDIPEDEESIDSEIEDSLKRAAALKRAKTKLADAKK